MTHECEQANVPCVTGSSEVELCPELQGARGYRGVTATMLEA
jgi:hypothetical protein